MNNRIKAILSLPKSIWVNLRYLPLRQAIYMPMLVAYNVTFEAKRGVVKLAGRQRFNSIRIGFHEVTVATRTKAIIRIHGCLVFEGTSYIGSSSRIYVGKNAKLILGDDFKISASSSIVCHQYVEFGSNIQFSWDCLVMDSDSHSIMYENGGRSSVTKPVVFGNDVWIGCRATILKGSIIPSNCVIGAGTTITGQSFEKNSIIAGSPPRVVKKIKEWNL